MPTVRVAGECSAEVQIVVGRIAVELRRELLRKAAQRMPLGVRRFGIHGRVDAARQRTIVGERATKPELRRKQQPGRTGALAFILLLEEAAL